MKYDERNQSIIVDSLHNIWDLNITNLIKIISIKLNKFSYNNHKTKNLFKWWNIMTIRKINQITFWMNFIR
jgi:hypothetical protein